MRTIFNSPSALLIACSLAAASASAVTFTNLYIFSADAFSAGPNPVATNSDGVNPNSIVLSGYTLYGTAAGGGLYGYGTIFRVDTDGQHFTNLFNFTNGVYDSTNGTYPGSLGDDPSPGLLLLSNTLYGTTFYGGTDSAGTVFKINTDGSGFALLHSFNFLDGQGPADGLALYSNVLYGTTVGGGANQSGAIFSINLSGSDFVNVYNFTNLIDPYGGLVVLSNICYGFGYYGGASNQGLVYSVNLRTAGYVDLFDFNGANGGGPYGAPTLSGNTLFGVTSQGGTNGGGNVFRLNTDGLQFTNLYNFQAEGGANITGAFPYGFTGLILSGDKLYGSTGTGGGGGQGTVFALNTDGSSFIVLHAFQYSDGANPEPLLLSNGALYGATLSGIQGVSLGDGAVFALALQPTLNLAVTNNDAVLTWNDSSYFLYAAPTLAGAFTKIIGSSSPYTNIVTGAQQFFQLRAN